MKEVVFMGGKEIGYHCLQHLLKHEDELGAKVVAVLSSNKMLFEEGLSINQLCTEHGIPILGSLKECLELDDFDILISVQYHEILKSEHIAKAKQIAINLHMAPLPEYRGCNQFSFAIIDGAKEFGTTIHRLEEKVDGGDILFEERFSVPENCFVKDLYMITYEKSLELFSGSIGSIVNGEYRQIPQTELLSERPTSYHYRKELEQIKQIDADWEVEKQARYFRATYFPPFDPPYTLVKGKQQTLTMEWYKNLIQS